ncbi:Probable licABCH operon regulator [Serratia fonticola]|uniref:Probable licABCH operon regulator n=1 Tax=Serratia fonticola TaxID=47917 RepID=A0A4U9W9A6_SERFO|nr:Probable licABCH operon regulator [Serratia fonticola]
MHYLLIRFLTSAFSMKLEDLADEWFVSRGTLQNDMAEVRERLAALSVKPSRPSRATV